MIFLGKYMSIRSRDAIGAWNLDADTITYLYCWLSALFCHVPSLITPSSLAVHPDKALIATGQIGKEPYICVWDSITTETVSILQKGHDRGVLGGQLQWKWRSKQPNTLFVNNSSNAVQCKQQYHTVDCGVPHTTCQCYLLCFAVVGQCWSGWPQHAERVEMERRKDCGYLERPHWQGGLAWLLQTESNHDMLTHCGLQFPHM